MTDDTATTSDETLIAAAGADSDEDEAEATAIMGIIKAMKPLSPEARRRTVGWAVTKYGVTGSPANARVDSQSGDASGSSGPAGYPKAEVDPESYADFAELFEAARPRTDIERTAVACYWVQVRMKKNPFISQDANSLLKNLGHQIRDVTEPFDALRRRSPSLVIQVKKDGSHQQSRKLYRVTPPGLKFVTDALRTGGFAETE